MRESMTSRERWLAALQCQPVDRLPFWPKLDAAYGPYQAQPFRSMTTAQMHDWIGSDQHTWAPPCVKVLRTQTAVEQTVARDQRRTTYHTPIGTLIGIDGYDPISRSWHPRVFPVKRVEDIEVMRYVYADQALEFDDEQWEQGQDRIDDLGENGIVATSLGISPLMDWIQHIAGVELGHLLLSDDRQAVESLFEEMHQSLCRRAEIIATRAPYQVVYSVENTSTTLISPQLFHRYCYPHLMEYGRIIGSSGKLHILHMCGKLKLLLPEIAELPASAIEAFTSPPVGNTTLPDGRSSCPDKCLIGGTNATLWLEPAQTIVDALVGDLDQLRHHRGLIVTSAGVMPPGCPPQVIREVCRQLRSYHLRHN